MGSTLELGQASFEELVAESKEKLWKLDEVLPRDAKLELSCPLLPDSLTGLAAATFLQPQHQLRLNQITGKSYVNLFCFVEEYIIRDVERMESMESNPSAEKDALGQFVAEEVKHQALFKRFMATFDRDYGETTEVLDFADDVADLIMSNSPLAVLLTTFHLEIITQEHYLKAIVPAENIEPHMISILHHHWLDESRHAAIDYLKIKELCTGLSPQERSTGLEQYLAILSEFFELLSMQAAHDVAALTKEVGNKLEPRDYGRLQFLQHQAYSRIFLELGLRHPVLRQIVSELMPGSEAELDFVTQKLRLG